MRCPNCEQETDANSERCSFCGYPLTDEPQPNKAAGADSEDNIVKDSYDENAKSPENKSRRRHRTAPVWLTAILSLLIIALLFTFVIFIYNKIKNDARQESGIFNREEDKDPLLLPNFETEAHVFFTMQTKSKQSQATDLTQRESRTSATTSKILDSEELEEATSSYRETSSVSTKQSSSTASSSASIRVIIPSESSSITSTATSQTRSSSSKSERSSPSKSERTNPIKSERTRPSSVKTVTNTVRNTESSFLESASATIISSDERSSEATSAPTSKSTVNETESDTYSTTVTSTSSTTTRDEKKIPCQLEIINIDESAYPQVRVYFGLANEDGEPLGEYDHNRLVVFERVKLRDFWQRQTKDLKFKANTNLCLVSDFSRPFLSGINRIILKHSLYSLIDDMNLNPDKPECNPDDPGCDPNNINMSASGLLDDDDTRDDEGESECNWDSFSMVNYGERIEKKMELTSYYEEAKTAIRTSRNLGQGKLLLDAIKTGIETAAEAEQSTVVVFTDGLDTGSESSIEDLTTLAQENHISVNIIYYNSYDDTDIYPDYTHYSANELQLFALSTQGNFSILEEDQLLQLGERLSSYYNQDKENMVLSYTCDFGEDARDKIHYLYLYYIGDKDESNIRSQPAWYLPPLIDEDLIDKN